MLVCVRAVEMLAQLEHICVVGYEPLSAVQQASGAGAGGGNSVTQGVLQRLHTLLYTTDFEGKVSSEGMYLLGYARVSLGVCDCVCIQQGWLGWNWDNITHCLYCFL